MPGDAACYVTGVNAGTTILHRNTAWVLSGGLAVLSACTQPAPSPALQATRAPIARPSPADALAAAYEQSIRAASVREPRFAVELRTIDAGQRHVRVATLTDRGKPAIPTERPIWVSLPDQLQTFCRGKPDPLLAMQQALGLPPEAAPAKPGRAWQVVTFTVPRTALFRPCPGGTDVGTRQCAADLAAEAFGATSANALDTGTTRFLLNQLWTSHRIGFRDKNGAPEWGYPFTGMGWTYNWDPEAASPVGVSEFIVRKNTAASALETATPAQFCNAGKR